MHGRKLAVVIVDDDWHRFSDTLKRLENAKLAQFYKIGNISEAIQELHNFKDEDQVDIILCDVNMFLERNPESVSAPFTVNGQSFSPTFGIAGLSAASERDAFQPYGPIIALPFARFFRNGGVIWPISTYWKDPRLLGDGRFNGYVFVALSLIWGQIDTDSGFAEKYAPLLGRNLKDVDIEAEFLRAVRERRAQLYKRALKVPGLLKIDPDKPADIEEVGAIRILYWDGGVMREDLIDARSLYADVVSEARRCRTSLPAARRRAVEQQLRDQLSKELNEMRDKLFDEERVFDFCKAYVLAYDPSRPRTFVAAYNALLRELAIPPEVIAEIAAPSDCNPEVRRFLLLFAQLLSVKENYHGSPNPHRKGRRSGGEAAKGKRRSDQDGATGTGGSTEQDVTTSTVNDAICDILGLPVQQPHALPDLLGNRKRKRASSDDTDPWMRPFNAKAQKGWQRFRLIGVGNQDRTFTDIDRTLGRKFWQAIGQDVRRIPFGL